MEIGGIELPIDLNTHKYEKPNVVLVTQLVTQNINYKQ